MGDVKNYIKRRLENDGEYSADYDSGYEEFKTGIILKTLRLQNGLTQKEFAERMKIKKSAVSQMENHVTQIRLSTLMRAARLFGKKISISID
ncbi:MAG: helix-turn-helix domain-containing protein [Spirochaetales bacterium]|jgi:DNA-binding XRE family transcriptional regulator|nr:helix-turn-helix domain-containing protein [Spirochaetales bacterium]